MSWSTFDGLARITQMTSTDGKSIYSYDTTSQLTQTDLDNQSDKSYAYDANGNRKIAGYDTGDNNQLLEDAAIERFFLDGAAEVASLDGGNVVPDCVDPDGALSSPNQLQRRATPSLKKLNQEDDVIETPILRLYMQWLVSSALACAFNLQNVDDYIKVYVDKERVALLSVPDANDISRIEVEMYCVSRIGTDLPDVGRFVVPPESYAEILEFFQEPKLDINPNYDLREIGMIKITTKDKSVVHIAYHDRLAMGELCFSILGARLTGGKKVRGQIDQAMTLDMHLRRVYHQVTGHIVDPEGFPAYPATKHEGKVKSRSQRP